MRQVEPLTITLTYPATFPCPQRTSYRVGYVYDTIESKMTSGWTRSRRRSDLILRAGVAEFKMDSTTFKQWFDFISKNYNNWMRMQLQSENVTAAVEPYLVTETVRFTGNINYNYLDWNTVQASLEFEFYHDPTGGTP